MTPVGVVRLASTAATAATASRRPPKRRAGAVTSDETDSRTALARVRAAAGQATGSSQPTALSTGGQSSVRPHATTATMTAATDGGHEAQQRPGASASGRQAATSTTIASSATTS